MAYKDNGKGEQMPLDNGESKLQKAGICVVLKKDKTTVRVEGNSPEEFKNILSKSEIAWINFTVSDLQKESAEISKVLNFDPEIVNFLLSSYSYNYEDRDIELGMKLPMVSVDNLEVSTTQLLILIRKGLILSIHETGPIHRLVRFSRYAGTFMRKIATKGMWNDQLTLLLWRIMDEVSAKNFEHLRQIEEQADSLVKDLMDPTTPRERLGPNIYKMKHALILYLDALWMSFDLISNLRYGDADVLSDEPEILNRLTSLGYDVTNQISLSEHMSEVLASGLEVLQSIYNNQLQIMNNRLALVVTWLTIVGTAVLVPNTIATLFGTQIGDYIDATTMWIILILSTALSAAASWLFIKRTGINKTCYR